MDTLRCMQAFVAVAECGSFAGAAEQLQVSAVMVGPGFSDRAAVMARHSTTLEIKCGRGATRVQRIARDAGGSSRAPDRTGADRKRTDPGSTPCTPTRRRADRSRNLATFHAGQKVASRVRRDARDGPSAATCLARLSQARSARKMPGLGPDRTRASIGAHGHEPSVGHPSRPAPAAPGKRGSLPAK